MDGTVPRRQIPFLVGEDMENPMRGYLLQTACFLVVGLWLTGCGGLDMGSEIRVPIGQRHEITRLVSGKAMFNLPGDHVFNIHLKTSTQNPGPNGTARGDADAGEDGSAYCLAEATNGGQAAAEFRLGQRLANRTGQVLIATIEADCRLDCRMQASEPTGPETLAETVLHLVVLDGHRRTLADVPLKNLTSDSGLGRASTTERHTLRVRMEPNQRYDVFLLGRTHARTGADRQARVRMDVRELQMRIRVQPERTRTRPAPVSGK